MQKIIVKIPRKNQKIFFSHAPLQITEKSQKHWQNALSNTLHGAVQNERHNNFFHFFYKGFEQNSQKDDAAEV